MNLEKAFEILKRHYGTHVRAALAVGYSATHYRQLRRTERINKRVEEWIITKAKECLAYENPLSGKRDA